MSAPTPEKREKLVRGLLLAGVASAGCVLVAGAAGALALYTLLSPCLNQTW